VKEVKEVLAFFFAVLAFFFAVALRKKESEGE
jgi:hypothetical protein